MTIDLCGSGGPDLGSCVAPVARFHAKRQGSLHIDAGKAPDAQHYNRFGGRFQGLTMISKIRNFWV